MNKAIYKGVYTSLTAGRGPLLMFACIYHFGMIESFCLLVYLYIGKYMPWMRCYSRTKRWVIGFDNWHPKCKTASKRRAFVVDVLQLVHQQKSLQELDNQRTLLRSFSGSSGVGLSHCFLACFGFERFCFCSIAILSIRFSPAFNS